MFSILFSSFLVDFFFFGKIGSDSAKAEIKDDQAAADLARQSEMEKESHEEFEESIAKKKQAYRNIQVCARKNYY